MRNQSGSEWSKERQLPEDAKTKTSTDFRDRFHTINPSFGRCGATYRQRPLFMPGVISTPRRCGCSLEDRGQRSLQGRGPNENIKIVSSFYRSCNNGTWLIKYLS